MKSVDEMAAGPRLDTLVAEKVMGLRTRRRTDIPSEKYEETRPPFSETYEGAIQLPSTGESVQVWTPTLNYSRSIEDAWEVVDEVTKNHGVSLRLAGPEYADGWTTAQGWHATFIESDYTFTDVGEGSRADTPALAICRAAYKFVVLNDKGSKAEVLR